LSVALLLASFRWAHHWGLVADTIVASWALATIGAPFVSIWSLNTSRASRRFAKTGIVLVLMSFVALTVVGVVSAAGVDVAGACGGG
jgi:hypothetical protein